VDREAYELDLSKRRAEHLARVMAFRKARSRGEPEAPAAQTPAAKWQPCKHDACLACHGTGIKVDDTTCIHTYIAPETGRLPVPHGTRNVLRGIAPKTAPLTCPGTRLDPTRSCEVLGAQLDVPQAPRAYCFAHWQ